MRRALSMMLQSDPDIQVVATARDGRDGIEKIQRFKPDLVTLDLEMPGMDGLTALGTIMKDMPLPVLVVSSLTTEGSQTTLDALNLGAVDFIPKELSYVSLDIVKIKEELISKVKQITKNRSRQFRRLNGSSTKIPLHQESQRRIVDNNWNLRLPKTEFKAVVIGISTGGPFALLQTIPQLPSDFPLGIIIVQHMPPRFTKSLADRLNNLSQVRVREAEDGDTIEPGLVLIAPGGQHLTLSQENTCVKTRVSVDPLNTMYRPSVDIAMESAAQSFQGPIIGVIMTGMGKDGLQGLKMIKQRNGYVIAQDKESCVVYGMPKVAVDNRLTDIILPLGEIPRALIQLARMNT
ncbi:MAG: chemotaxis response regulator protein-glutamate methylesterase [Ignavibacteria bacterium]|nr:chemotaxis response regulator protein-glutamate methylesterase [Ignavibacteria bacterium]